MARALFWTRSGPGEHEVPDSLPITYDLKLFLERTSRRGERHTEVLFRTYHRQLFVARMDDNPAYGAWASWPATRLVKAPHVDGKNPGTVLLMAVYTEWPPEPKKEASA